MGSEEEEKEKRGWREHLAPRSVSAGRAGPGRAGYTGAWAVALPAPGTLRPGLRGSGAPLGGSAGLLLPPAAPAGRDSARSRPVPPGPLPLGHPSPDTVPAVPTSPGPLNPQGPAQPPPRVLVRHPPLLRPRHAEGERPTRRGLCSGRGCQHPTPGCDGIGVPQNIPEPGPPQAPEQRAHLAAASPVAAGQGRGCLGDE